VGINEWHAGDHQTALKHYQQAEIIEPEFCQTNYWIGRVLLDQKDYNQVGVVLSAPFIVTRVSM
jgi:hypothetical protein